MCAAAVSNILCSEWKLKRTLQDDSAIACIFPHKGKSNTSFGTLKGLLLFVNTHNINKTLCFYKIKKTNMKHFLQSHLDQERFTKMNRNSAKCLTVLTERFQLLHNEIKQIENKTSFIIILIHKDAFLSKAASNEEKASQDQHPCETDSENTSLLVNN